MQCELNEVESPEGAGEQSAVSTPGTSSSPQTSLPQSHPSTSSNNSSDGLRDNVPCLKYASQLNLHNDISMLVCSVNLLVDVVCEQGQEFPSQAVSRLPGGAGHSAGVGQRGAATTHYQPLCQLGVWPVSHSVIYQDVFQLALLVLCICVIYLSCAQSCFRQRLWSRRGRLHPENSSSEREHGRTLRFVGSSPQTAAFTTQSQATLRR